MNKRGFTLIELLIVIVVIGLLAGMATVRSGGTKTPAYLATMKSDLHNMILSQEAHFDSLLTAGVAGAYAGTMSDLSFTPSQGVTVKLKASASGWSAQLKHDNAGDRECAVFIGDIAGPYTPASLEGLIDCKLASGPACS